MNHQAIYNTHSLVKSIADNEDGSVTAYDHEGNAVTLDGSEVAEVERLQAEYDNAQYARDRIYPTWQEQADMQYHDAVDGTTTWADAIAAVKAEFPKPV